MANNNDKSQNPSIQGCSLKWRVQCPMKWENLELTDSDNVRFCASCERSVYQVFSEYEAQVKADQGECIALFQKDSTVGLIGEVEMPNSINYRYKKAPTGRAWSLESVAYEKKFHWYEKHS